MDSPLRFKIKLAFFGTFPSLICAGITLLFIYLLTDPTPADMKAILLCAGLMLPVMVGMSIWFDQKWQRPLVRLINAYQAGHALSDEQIHTIHWRAHRFPIYTYIFNLSWWLAGAVVGSTLFTIFKIQGRDIFYIFMSAMAGGIVSALVQFYCVKSFLWKNLTFLLSHAERKAPEHVRSPLTIRSKLLLSFLSVIVPSLILSSLLAYSMIFKELRNRDIRNNVLLGTAMADELMAYSHGQLDWQGFHTLLDRYERIGLRSSVSLYDRTGRELFGTSPLPLPSENVKEILTKTSNQSLDLRHKQTLLSFLVPGKDLVLLFACPWDVYAEALSGIRWALAVGTLILFIALIIITYFTSNDISTPLHSLRQRANEIAQGKLDCEVEVFSDDEVGELAWALREMTHHLRESNRILEIKVKERTQSLETANKELSTLNKIKDEFLSSVSHELRTPLTSIRSFSEILLRYPSENEETRNEFLHIINNESQRLTRLINELLDLAKIESGKMKWCDEKLEVREVLAGVVGTFKVLVEGKQLSLRVRALPGLPSLWMDRDRLVQVITNLLSNAVKFTNPGGSVDVEVEWIKGKRLKDKDGLIKFCVSDTGIGIPEKDHKIIFEKFIQCGDTLKDKPKGTGLGLPICKNIIAHYGGDIWVESSAGQGSRFYFTLPCLPDPGCDLTDTWEDEDSHNGQTPPVAHCLPT